MKRIPPAIQEKERYLKFRVHGAEKEIGEVVDAVWESAIRYMGSQGASEADIRILGDRFSEEDQTGIVRVRADKEDDLRAALALDPCMDDAFFSVEKVSGTVTGL
jgi:RNase P/RNase MRP subunit POP5